MIEKIVEYINSNIEKIADQMNNFMNENNDIENYFVDLLIEEFEDNKEYIKYKYELEYEDISEVNCVTDVYYIIRHGYTYKDDEYCENDNKDDKYHDDVHEEDENTDYDYDDYDYEEYDEYYEEGFISPEATLDEYFNRYDFGSSDYREELTEFINSLMWKYLKKYLEKVFNTTITDKDYKEILEYVDYYDSAYSIVDFPPMFDVVSVMDLLHFRSVRIYDIIGYRPESDEPIENFDYEYDHYYDHEYESF